MEHVKSEDSGMQYGNSNDQCNRQRIVEQFVGGENLVHKIEP